MEGLDSWIDKPVSVRSGEEVNAENLASYLTKYLALSPGNLTIDQFPSGYSNLTYLLKSGEQELVLRRPPLAANIKSGHDMGREYKILKALSKTYQKVPRPILYCDDISVIGAPFYIMERMSGIILRAKMPKERHPDPRTMSRISDALVDALIELHQIDYVDAGLVDLGRPEGYVARQIAGWTKRYLNSKSEDIDNISEIIKWLTNHLPRESGSALIHNDFKYDNLVLDANNSTKIVAILDWEMSTLGDPLMDLGTTLGYWVTQNDPDWMQGLALSPTVLPGNPSRAELAQKYALKSKMDLGQIVFYYVYGLFKIAVITQQIYYRYKHGLTSDVRFAGLIDVVKGLGTMATRAIERKRLDNLF